MHLLTMFPKTSHNLLCITWQETEKEPRHNLEKRTLQNLEPCIIWEWRMEDSTEIPGLVLYQTLFYFLKKIATSFDYNTKFKIQVVILMCLAILLSKHDT